MSNNHQFISETYLWIFFFKSIMNQKIHLIQNIVISPDKTSIIMFYLNKTSMMSSNHVTICRVGERVFKKQSKNGKESDFPCLNGKLQKIESNINFFQKNKFMKSNKRIKKSFRLLSICFPKKFKLFHEK